LKLIDLSFSKNLVETPDLSEVPNLEKLNLEYCTSLSKVHPSTGFLIHLRSLNLQGCKSSLGRLVDEMRSKPRGYLYLSKHSSCGLIPELRRKICVAGSGSDLISILMPTSFSSLRSLIKLDFSNCNLSDGAIPNDLCCLSSLRDLNLSGNKFTRIPDIWQLSELITLNLSYCNLFDAAIPNDLSGMSSLYHLNLSGNNFTRLPDTLAQLSRLDELDLEDCSRLQVLPKLPFGLTELSIRNCPSLKMFYEQMDVWISNEILRSTHWSSVALHCDYDGKPSKILYLHPRSPLWIASDHFVSLLV